MDPDQIEYLAEKTKVGIIPNFSNDPLHLISGYFGPFRAGHAVHVPLWLAIHLRKQQKCRIVPPEWMNVDDLTDAKEDEKNARFFKVMPCEHYFIVAKQILGVAPDDVPHLEEVRTLIKDIWDIRLAKLRGAVKHIIEGDKGATDLDNVTQMELATVRPLFTKAMDVVARLKVAPANAASSSTSQGRTTSDRSVHGTSSRSTSRFTFN